MTDTQAAELIHLADEDSSVVVRVLGRLEPGVLLYHDLLRAEIIVESAFAKGELPVPLRREDLDDWEQALEALAAEQNILWMGYSDPNIKIEFDDDSSYLGITVTDAAASATSISIAVDPPDDWLRRHRARLQLVRDTWPCETIETSYGSVMWRT